VKQNVATKDCSKKMLEDELAGWFANARDRGKGDRKSSKSTVAKNPAIVYDENDVMDSEN
jgi:hypothetical protein